MVGRGRWHAQGCMKVCYIIRIFLSSHGEEVALLVPAKIVFKNPGGNPVSRELESQIPVSRESEMSGNLLIPNRWNQNVLIFIFAVQALNTVNPSDRNHLFFNMTPRMCRCWLPEFMPISVTLLPPLPWSNSPMGM